jgi:hypothetical protein
VDSIAYTVTRSFDNLAVSALAMLDYPLRVARTMIKSETSVNNHPALPSNRASDLIQHVRPSTESSPV